VIISKTPFRVSFFGGGTDFPLWYKKKEGLIISSTIDKYCYVLLRTLPPFFSFKYRLRYYQTELQKNISQIKHPVIKAALKNFNKKKNGLEISHFADVPALSGLGASSAFTVSIVNAIYAYNNKKITKNEIAKKAIYLEQKILKENVGSQDQIATAFGGFNFISFKRNKFSVNKIKMDSSILNELQNRLVLIYINSSRKADIIEKKKMQSLEKNVAYYDRLLEIAHEAKNVFSSNSNKILFETGRLLNETWHVKKKLDKSVSNSTVENLYEFGIKNGAVAGKLLGAGSGGFFLFLSKSFQEKRKLINSFKRNMHVDFKFEDLGTRIILNKKDYYDV